MASTSRRYDTEQGRFVDSATLWVNVTCWRALAENVDHSVKKGQPVVVTGRIFCREYEVNETNRLAYELEATAVGHDLSRGTSAFEKAVRLSGVQVAVDAEGLPADESDRWLDLADPDAPADTEGEVVSRELVAAS
jgi:single-strand DNA-binding protein